MARSGYTSLSIEEKQYAKIRRNFEVTVKTNKTFTMWAMDALITAINREKIVNEDYPGIRFIGNKTGGVILEDKSQIIEISVGKNLLTCSQDKGICKHILFAVLHPSFEM
jgi:hypothetical protein